MTSDELRAHAHKVDVFWEELGDLYYRLPRRSESRRNLDLLMGQVHRHIVDTLSVAYAEMLREMGIDA